MPRVLIISIVSAAVGICLGYVQGSVNSGGLPERFRGARAATAITAGEISEEEALQAVSGTPRVEVVGGTDFDFGMMLHGEELSHDFLFRNVGDAPLLLEMGESSCKCTVGDLESSVLQPGEETEVKLTWKAQALTRQFGQSATIYTNDTENLEVKLQVMGEIAQSFVMEPGAIELGSVSDTETIERTFHIFTYLKGAESLSDFEWTDAQTRDLVDIHFEQVELDPSKFPDHQNAMVAHRVDFSLQPGFPIGPLSSRIQFKSDRGDAVGTLGLPVSGTVVGQLELRGGPSFDERLNLLKLGNVDSAEGISRSLYLFVQGDNHQEIIPEIESVRPSEALKVSIGEPKISAKRSIYTLQFEVPKGAPKVNYPATGGTKYGRVMIRTKGAVEKELPINIRLIVRD